MKFNSICGLDPSKYKNLQSHIQSKQVPTCLLEKKPSA